MYKAHAHAGAEAEVVQWSRTEPRKADSHWTIACAGGGDGGGGGPTAHASDSKSKMS